VTAPADVEARLTAPGAPFEIVEEMVLGAPLRVFRSRLPSLRALLETSAAHAANEYLVADDGRRITYGENLRNVAAVAAALRERYGVGPGDRVAILAANCPEWIVTFWATVSLGAIAVGLNGWWTGDEILYGLADCQPKVLVADGKRLARLEGKDPGVPVVAIETGFARLWNHDRTAPLPSNAVAEDDPALILYTSGTTGRPKGALQSHRNIIAMVGLHSFSAARGMMLAPAPPPGLAPAGPPCILVTNPLFHVSGLHSAAITCLANGIRSVWNVGRFDPVRAMQIIERERVTGWGAMNTVVWRMMRHPEFGKYDLSSLRNIGNGGAPTPPELQRQVREHFPAIGLGLGHGYGSTESTALATIINGEEWQQHPESVGQPLPTVDIEIRDPEGLPLAEGEEGEVCIRSPLVMLRYWNRPAETAETIAPGRWLRTGDIGRMSGGRLYLASRKRDLILRGAENVYPVEIENRLAEHAGIEEVAVVGVKHEELGQEVKAIVVVDGDPTPDELAQHVAARLAYFKVPAHWELRREPLPRNATGKILKHVLTDGAVNPFVEE